LKRVVFVIEQRHSRHWPFRIGQRLIDNVFDCVPNGCALVYGMRAGSESAWSDKFRMIRRFATEPRRFLPQSYQFVDGECCIDVVIGTHTTSDTCGGDTCLEYCTDSSKSLPRWVAQMSLMFPANKNGREGDGDDRVEGNHVWFLSQCLFRRSNFYLATQERKVNNRCLASVHQCASIQSTS
jgi:hypothetical protein